jgi:F-type H+-transporting ATPase subunit gamma
MPEQAKVIRKRIKSVSSTKKITKTMEMIAGAKLRIAQQRVQSSGPYLDQLRGLMREIGASGVDVSRWPHFEVREGKRTLLWVLTANRGLCGGFNANLIRLGKKTYDSVIDDGGEVLLHVSGRKGISAFRYQGVPTAARYIDEMKDRPAPDDAEFFLDVLTRPFLDGEVDEVLVVYPHWINVARQPPTVLRLLPIAPDTGEEDGGAATAAVPPLFEPSAEEILDRLLPLYLRQTIYSVLAEAVACEQIARRVAMKLATDNADEMVTNLTRQHNKARQAQITKELAEIIGGAEALK